MKGGAAGSPVAPSPCQHGVVHATNPPSAPAGPGRITRVEVRPPEPVHAAVFERLFDAEVMRWIGDGTVRDLAYYEGFVARQRESFGRDGVGLGTILADGEVAGFCGVHRWTPEWGPTGAWEIGWRLGREYQGLSVASRVARLVLSRLLGGRDVFLARGLVAMIHEDNAASRRLAERLGFHPAETLLSPDGEPVVVHRLTRRGRQASVRGSRDSPPQPSGGPRPVRSPTPDRGR